MAQSFRPAALLLAGLSLLGCAGANPKKVGSSPAPAFQHVGDLGFLPLRRLEDFEKAHANAAASTPLPKLETGRVTVLPQHHSMMYMFIEHKTPEESLASLDTFEEPFTELFPAAHSQYVLLQALLRSDNELLVLNEGSPGFDAVERPVSSALVERIKQIFPTGFNVRFRDLTLEQLQVLSHVGGVNLLFVTGHLSRVLTEAPECARTTKIPEFTSPRIPDRELFEMVQVEERGPKNRFEVSWRAHSPASYKYWIIDRELRLGEVIRRTAKAHPSRPLAVVFGNFHHYASVKDLEFEFLPRTNQLLEIMGYDTIENRKLDASKYKLTHGAIDVMRAWLPYVWASIDENLCASGRR